MARRHRGRHRGKRRHSRSGMSSFRSVRRGLGSNRLWNTLAGLAGVGAFVQQTTSNDYSYSVRSGYWGGLSGTQKAQVLFSWVTSRIASVFGMSYSPFPALAGPVRASLNPGNILNKWFGLGVGSLIYSALGKHIPMLPFRAKVKKFGKPLIAAGIIGGLLDDPVAVRAGVPGSARPSGLNQTGGVLTSSGPIYRGGGNLAGYAQSSQLNQR